MSSKAIRSLFAGAAFACLALAAQAQVPQYGPNISLEQARKTLAGAARHGLLGHVAGVGLQEQVTADYNRYEFHRVVQALQGFCSEELGAFYLDILKDRLYTTGANSRPRRAAQGALWHILQALIRLMAPVLTFTAEEIWQVLTKSPEDSVMLVTWHALPDQAEESALVTRWQQIREVRAEVSKVLEERRVAGKIGSSLQAEVAIRASGSKHELLASLGNDLRLVLICLHRPRDRARHSGGRRLGQAGEHVDHLYRG